MNTWYCVPRLYCGILPTEVAEVPATFFCFSEERVDVPKAVEELITPALAQEGLELVELEWRREPVGWVLRLFLDKAGGINLDECAAWNDRLGELIDGAELISHPYSLEISSPGLDRPLRKESDFRRYIGLDCILKTTEPLGHQQNFRGKMTSVEGSNLMLYDRTSGLVAIPLDKIARAKLDTQS